MARESFAWGRAADTLRDLDHRGVLHHRVSGFGHSEADGATDDFGYNVETVVNVRDLHATMLHLLGIRHERLTYKYQGLDMRLTGVEPSRVVHEVLES